MAWVGLVLRKRDLAHEAEEGEAACDTLFRMDNFDDDANDDDEEGRLLGFRDEDALQRYLLSLDGVHTEVTGEPLGSARVGSSGGREYDVAFARRRDPPLLYVFARESDPQVDFKVLSDLAITVLGAAAGLGVDRPSALRDLPGLCEPKTTTWLRRVVERHSGPSGRPPTCSAGAERERRIAGAIATALVTSAMGPSVITAFEPKFTLLADVGGSGRLDIAYACDLRDSILPFCVCDGALRESLDKMVMAGGGSPCVAEGSVVAAGTAILGGRDGGLVGGGRLVKVYRLGSLALCLSCAPRQRQDIGGAARETDLLPAWGWVERGMEEVCRRVLRDAEAIVPSAAARVGGQVLQYRGGGIFT